MPMKPESNRKARALSHRLIADRLISDHREIIELGFEAKLIEKVDFNFHEECSKKAAKSALKVNQAPLSVLLDVSAQIALRRGSISAECWHRPYPRQTTRPHGAYRIYFCRFAVFSPRFLLYSRLLANWL
jgi:hypothetical protein